MRLSLSRRTRKSRRQQRVTRQQHPRLKSLQFKAAFLFGGRVQN
jgi:hypothetical protein